MGQPELTPPATTCSSVDGEQSPLEFLMDEFAEESNETLQLIGTTRFAPLPDIKNILITGGAGFIGGWVTRHLTVRYPEYNIICFDKLDDVSSLANIRCLHPLPNFHFVEGDLTDPEAISSVLRDFSIDCVMHFAACSHVQNSFSDPSSFTLNNVVGTQRLLDGVRALPGQVRRFIHVSTDEVYGDTAEEFVDETKQFMPTNPYSASKAAAEMYVWAYARSFAIPAVVVRSNNVYGPCQYPEKIIPRFHTLLTSSLPLTLQGTGLNVRRYLHGSDAADGFDTILHKGQVGEAYNLMSEDGISNLELAVRMLEIWGLSPQEDFSRWLKWVADRPFNDRDYRVDGSKLKALGWGQKVSFQEGLKGTIEWYKGNLERWWPGVLEKVAGEGSGVGEREGEEVREGGGTRRTEMEVEHAPPTVVAYQPPTAGRRGRSEWKAGVWGDVVDRRASEEVELLSKDFGAGVVVSTTEISGVEGA